MRVGLAVRFFPVLVFALLAGSCFDPQRRTVPNDTEANGSSASEDGSSSGSGSGDETRSSGEADDLTSATDTPTTTGETTHDTLTTSATEATSSGGVCEDGMREDCWETADGMSLPDLGGELQGECRMGVRVCSPDGVWGACQGAIGPAPSDSCIVAGADNDCNGIPNEGCACTGSESRPCGVETGNCELGTQTCQNEIWGACVGGVQPAAADSCEVAEDDANCNGVPNEGCPCIGNETASCSDCATRTCDPSNRAWGECMVQSSSCTIDGVCYGHNAANPENPCQYCDATLNQSGWTNASGSVTCDDGRFCNGSDTCNGLGECVHQFPNDSRCDDVSGPCARASCDEQARSCVLPNTEVCGQRTEYRCQPNVSCGAQTQRRTVRRFCSGSSAACDGPEVADTSWQSSGTCDADESCSSTGTSTTCAAEIECVAWCDETDLCWLHEAPARMNLDSANTHCNAGSWGGDTDWRLPTVDEWISVFRGCDDDTISGLVASSCEMTPFRCVEGSGSCDGVNECTGCTENQGPDSNNSNCYWEPSLQGPCNDVYGYWTSTSFMGASDRWVAHPRAGRVFGFGVIGNALNTKCVTQR